MQINYFAYYPDKWPSWPLAWQSWLLSFSTVLLLDYQCPRKFCWKLLSCILNSHKMQNKPVPVSGRRDPTAPGWHSSVKPLPFPLPPKNPCIVSCRPGHECWMVSEGTATREEAGGKFLFLTNFCRVSYHFGNFLSHESEWVAQLLLSCLQGWGEIHS